MDLVIPIVFPDYRVSVEIKKTEVDVFPWIEFDNFTVPSYKDKVSNLGHAGVLFVNGKTGVTKYYEYGRYDSQNLGLVVKARGLPNVKLSHGKLDLASLKKVLSFISRVSGQSGKIHGAYIEVKGKYDAMLQHANFRKNQNGNPRRKQYDILTNNCIHFVKEITEKAGVSTPWMVDPRPNSYIGEFRDDFLDLDFNKDSLIIEGHGKY